MSSSSLSTKPIISYIVLVSNKADGQVKLCDFGLAVLRQQTYHLTTQCGTDNYGKATLPPSKQTKNAFLACY